MGRAAGTDPSSADAGRPTPTGPTTRPLPPTQVASPAASTAFISIRLSIRPPPPSAVVRRIRCLGWSRCGTAERKIVIDMDHADRGETSQPRHRLPLLAPFRAAVTRRRFLQLGGTAARGDGRRGPPARRDHRSDQDRRGGKRVTTGTIADLKHVVIIMQETGRSTTTSATCGACGFADKQALGIPEQHHHLRAAGRGPDGPRLSAAIPNGLVESERPERGGPGPQLGW